MTSRSEIPLGAPAPTAAIVALVAVVATLLIAVVRNRPGDPSSPAAPEEPRLADPTEPEPELEPELEPATVLALIDAIPWGRVDRIESATGDAHELPEPRETPVLLRLPAGTWRVSLTHPAFAEERECEFTLDDGQRHDCLVEFDRVTVDQYFRETGWWR